MDGLLPKISSLAMELTYFLFGPKVPLRWRVLACPPNRSPMNPCDGHELGQVDPKVQNISLPLHMEGK